jgi:hypothetical protein
LVLRERSTPDTFDAGVFSLVRRHADRDEALIVSDFAEEDRVHVGSESILARYWTVRRKAYELVKDDLEHLLRGSAPLGLEAI